MIRHCEKAFAFNTELLQAGFVITGTGLVEMKRRSSKDINLRMLAPKLSKCRRLGGNTQGLAQLL